AILVGLAARRGASTVGTAVGLLGFLEVLGVVVPLLARVAIVIAPRARIVALHAAVGDYPEVVVGELQVILGLHAVAVERRVVGELLVLLEQLGRVAACPAVDPVALAAAALAAIAAATAPAIVVAIILVQRKSVS